MGAVNEKVQNAADKNKISDLRKKYAIKDSDFLIVSGGKIDHAKQQTLLLMEAVKELSHKFPVKLIVFGSVSNELKDEVNKLSDGTIVNYIGWIQPDDSYDFFSAADLVVFPGRHSVFWEQVVGIGKPLVVKYWDGTTHVQVNGNAEFLIKDSAEEIKNKISGILDNNKYKYNQMLVAATGKAKQRFSYREIALRSLGQQ